VIEQWIRWRLAQAGVTIDGPLGMMPDVLSAKPELRARLRPEPLAWVDSGDYASRCILRLVALDVARVHGVWRVDAENHDRRALYRCGGFESKEEAQRHAIAWALQAHDDETARCLASLIDLDALVTR
jgi:hypothetical protein